MTEFSKSIVKRLCRFWFIGGAFGLLMGVYAVCTEITTADTVYNFLIVYIGAPFGGTVLGYLVKAAFENVNKINRAGPSKDTSVTGNPVLGTEPSWDFPEDKLDL